MNGRKFIGASALTIALMLGAAGTANASNIDCSTDLGNLSNAINTAVYTKDRDKVKMDDKAADAGLKIAKHKFGGAEDKVTSINTKTKALRDATKPKIFGAVEAILDEVDNVLDCVPGGLSSLPH